ncbi:MAG: aminopeptidase P family protein [Cyclobacteriaceae bacterium]|nr:aminopeptidase P family protein [Cyclobacteriaceae bacterium]
MFDAQTYIERRKRLKEKVGSGSILLLGNEESSVNFKDNWYHYRQDSSFLYYFGITLPGLVGVLNCDTNEEIIFGDELTIDQIIWTGPQPTIAQLANKCGVDTTLPTTKITNFLQGLVHYLPPYRTENQLKISEWLGAPMNFIHKGASVDLIKAIIAMRSYKTAAELIEIEKAVDITADMHLNAMRYAKAGMLEAEVVGKLHQIATSGGGNLSFPVILSKDGQILHNHYHGNVLNEGDMVLCDAGAETSMGYAGDMTRTFPVGEKFTAQQKELYQIVLNAHESAITALKPGIKYRDVHLLASKTLVEGLIAVGLMKGSAEEAVNAGAHTLFFQCGLGHMMGLDVHDMEDLGEQYVGYTDTFTKSTDFGLKSLRLGKAVEKDFVLTVEPGIYVIPELIDMWKAEKKHHTFVNYDVLETYRNFGGIRIEEDFVITASGSRLLGKPVPKTIEEIEQVRAESLAAGNG